MQIASTPPSLTQAAATHVANLVTRRRERGSQRGSIGVRFLSALAQLLRTEKIQVRTLEDLRQDSKEASAAVLDVHDPDLDGYCGTFSCCVYLKIHLKETQGTQIGATTPKNSLETPPLFSYVYWNFGANETDTLIHESVHAVRIHLSKNVSPELFTELQVWNFGTTNDPLYHTIEAREEWIAYTMSWYVQQFPVKRSLDFFASSAIRFVSSNARSSNTLYSGVTDDLLQQTQDKADMRKSVEQTLSIAIQTASTQAKSNKNSNQPTKKKTKTKTKP
jgi:hypothetical protein